jgi:hypothetical protein
MASIRRQGTRVQIRECRSTPRGPRQFLLVSFVGALTPEVLDRAEERARAPLDRRRLAAAARRKGIPVAPERRCAEARLLLARLRRGEPVAPTLVSLLRAALERLPARPLPAHLEDAAEWLGRSDFDRGNALRGVLRTADRILRSRGAVRERPAETFPRFRTLAPAEA